MFREIRRRDRALPEAEAWEILNRAKWGVLSTMGADGWPYGVPLNHVVVDGQIYAHCAQEGHKIDNLAFKSRVSYCAVANAELRPEELATDYESVILFGRAVLVTDEAEKRKALEALVMRFAPGHMTEGAEEIRRDLARTTILRIAPERITGKARRQI